jgi:hypothetical protein
MFLVDRSLLVSVKISLCLVIGNILICDRSGECSRNQTLCTHMARRCEVLTAATLRITASRDVVDSPEFWMHLLSPPSGSENVCVLVDGLKKTSRN